MNVSETACSELLIATSNPGKIREIQLGLHDLPLRLRLLAEFPKISQPHEVGESYEQNAIIKATAYAKQTGLWALADDSGLEVDFLGGAPGLKSARLGGTSDSERIGLLLSKLSGVYGKERGARFRCIMAIVDPDIGVINIAEGICNGTIGRAPVGGNGFGYDPIFIPEGYKLTFAQLPTETKTNISHRALALATTRKFLSRLLVDP